MEENYGPDRRAVAASQSLEGGPDQLAARQRLAVRVMTLPAVLAALAALVQIYDSVSGKGSLWNVFVSVGITAWWVTIAIYLSERRGR